MTSNPTVSVRVNWAWLYLAIASHHVSMGVLSLSAPFHILSVRCLKRAATAPAPALDHRGRQIGEPWGLVLAFVVWVLIICFACVQVVH